MSPRWLMVEYASTPFMSRCKVAERAARLQDPFRRSASRLVLLGREFNGGMRLEPARQQLGPDAFRIVCEAEQIEVGGIDHSEIDQSIEVDDRLPILAIGQDDWNARSLVRLTQGQDLEQLVDRAETTGE